MKKSMRIPLAVLLLPIMAGCSGLAEEVQSGDYRIIIEPGEEWIHDFSALTKNPPQFALWVEDETGNYLDTVFVTRKIATEGWVFNGGNRRVESLPRWMFQRNHRGEDGTLLPSREDPLTDGVTGATPKESVEIQLRPHVGLDRFRLVLEINHSTDFNRNWPEDASEGDADWTGGSGGSGQPSLIYSALIDRTSRGPWILDLEGHGSPDGSDDSVTPDVSSLTTALKILEQAVVSREL